MCPLIRLCLTGQDLPPYQYIPEEGQKDKEHQVFDKAMSVTTDVYWNGVHHDGELMRVDYVVFITMVNL